MDYVLWFLIASVVSGSVLGGIVRAWSILSRLSSLERDIAVIQGAQTRLAKTMAAQSRWDKKSKQDIELEELMNHKAEPAATSPSMQWWK